MSEASKTELKKLVQTVLESYDTSASRRALEVLPGLDDEELVRLAGELVE